MWKYWQRQTWWTGNGAITHSWWAYFRCHAISWAGNYWTICLLLVKYWTFRFSSSIHSENNYYVLNLWIAIRNYLLEWLFIYYSLFLRIEFQRITHYCNIIQTLGCLVFLSGYFLFFLLCASLSEQRICFNRHLNLPLCKHTLVIAMVGKTLETS